MVKGRVPGLRVTHSSNERKWVSNDVRGADVRDRVLRRAIRRARGGEDRMPRALCVPLSAAECL